MLSEKYTLLRLFPSAISIHTKELHAHTMKMMPVDVMMFPNPTNGDTTPPKAKPTAPNKAEAVPAFCRWLSIARVVVEVNVSPIVNKSSSNKLSYIQKLHDDNNAPQRANEMAVMLTHPVSVLLSGRLNLTDRASATQMVLALMAKHKLNASGVKP